MPLLDVRRLEGLQRYSTEERPDLVFEQPLITLLNPSADPAERCPSLDPLGDMGGDGERRARDIVALVDSGDEPREFGLRGAPAAFDCPIFRDPLAGRVPADVELEFKRAGSVVADGLS
jgi:hypothetical protein